MLSVLHRSLRSLPLVVVLSLVVQDNVQENAWAHVVAVDSVLNAASRLMNLDANAEKSCCCHDFIMLPPSAVLSHNLQRARQFLDSRRRKWSHA